MNVFHYTRDGEHFYVSAEGIRLVRADGSVPVQRQIQLPADVVASTVLELVFAGWTLVE